MAFLKENPQVVGLEKSEQSEKVDIESEEKSKIAEKLSDFAKKDFLSFLLLIEVEYPIHHLPLIFCSVSYVAILEDGHIVFPFLLTG